MSDNDNCPIWGTPAKITEDATMVNPPVITVEGYARLADRISAVIGDGPNKSLP